MSNRTPHVVGGGLGTFRAKDKAAYDKRQAAIAAAEAADVRANNARLMRAMAEHKHGVNLSKV